MTIDPGAISFVQTIFLRHLQAAFVQASHYATNLLYLFAGIELALFGLIWALQQSSAWERLFFKVLKIGLIIFIIQNYSYLFHIIIQSFSDLGSLVGNTAHLSQLIFNPAHIWQYGYNVGIDLIKGATFSSGIGLTLVLVLLGFGILMTFGLLGIQIVLQIVAFYLIAFVNLIFLPFGVFEPSSGMFEKSIQSLLKAGVRVMVLMMVIGVAMISWKSLGVMRIKPPYNINVPLGLFFTSLLFLYLGIKLPKIASQAVGEISSRFLPEKAPEMPGQMFKSGAASTTVSPLFDLASIQAATTIQSSPGISTAVSTSPQIGTASTVVTSGSSMLSTSEFTGSKQQTKTGLSKASLMTHRSISDKQLKQIRSTILKAIKDQKL